MEKPFIAYDNGSTSVNPCNVATYYIGEHLVPLPQHRTRQRKR